MEGYSQTFKTGDGAERMNGFLLDTDNLKSEMSGGKCTGVQAKFSEGIKLELIPIRFQSSAECRVEANKPHLNRARNVTGLSKYMPK